MIKNLILNLETRTWKLIRFFGFVLPDYSSIVTVSPEIIDGRSGTVVIESFVVDAPEGNTPDETCYFVKALLNCNMKSLADISERMAVQDKFQSIDLSKN